MKKRGAALFLALCLLCTGACAEIFDGEMSFLEETTVYAPASGTLASLTAEAGDQVTKGETLGRVSEKRVFATADGTVSIVHAYPGEDVSGTVLEIAPTEKYLVYCTVTTAYQSPESAMVCAGETLYMKCSHYGTHRAVGIVTTVDGEEYHVETIGGVLYVGETVELYRSEDFDGKTQVGTGTVVQTDTVKAETTGTLLSLRVNEGDRVEKGQLLYTWSDSEQLNVTASASGVVTQVLAEAGDTVNSDDPLFRVAEPSQLAVSLKVEEESLKYFALGSSVTLYTETGYNEETCQGTVTRISEIAENDTYQILVACPGASWPLGMSIRVETGETK